tara:strand:- start:3417 stop:3854 length:438 start_codon:yes stop_codon:yes gene_type:complete
MEKEFVPYEQSLALKELGFNDPCFGWFRSTLIPSNFTDFFLETEFGMNESPSDWVNSNFLNKACSAPLYQQSFRWFLKEYKLFKETTLWGDGIGYMSQIKEIKQEEFLEVYNLGLVAPNRGLPNWDEDKEDLECLKKLIEIVKNK